ncbi:MAG: uncharacterized protein KVP18_001554 [Porospora cf. gigantea A]|uniref:uncharacterized protein n=1 Tax=Porospora cf. gigantea A TaxID=2853593 RepID=UPI00355A8BBB|nr:MAG: hypothetical protein KVP18_001554 [Porospora cf. gigantea A]
MYLLEVCPLMCGDIHRLALKVYCQYFALFKSSVHVNALNKEANEIVSLLKQHVTMELEGLKDDGTLDSILRADDTLPRDVLTLMSHVYAMMYPTLVLGMLTSPSGFPLSAEMSMVRAYITIFKPTGTSCINYLGRVEPACLTVRHRYVLLRTAANVLLHGSQLCCEDVREVLLRLAFPLSLSPVSTVNGQASKLAETAAEMAASHGWTQAVMATVLTHAPLKLQLTFLERILKRDPRSVRFLPYGFSQNIVAWCDSPLKQRAGCVLSLVYQSMASEDPVRLQSELLPVISAALNSGHVEGILAPLSRVKRAVEDLATTLLAEDFDSWSRVRAQLVFLLLEGGRANWDGDVLVLPTTRVPPAMFRLGASSLDEEISSCVLKTVLFDKATSSPLHPRTRDMLLWTLRHCMKSETPERRTALGNLLVNVFQRARFSITKTALAFAKSHTLMGDFEMAYELLLRRPEEYQSHMSASEARYHSDAEFAARLGKVRPPTISDALYMREIILHVELSVEVLMEQLLPGTPPDRVECVLEALALIYGLFGARPYRPSIRQPAVAPLAVEIACLHEEPRLCILLNWSLSSWDHSRASVGRIIDCAKVPTALVESCNRTGRLLMESVRNTDFITGAEFVGTCAQDMLWDEALTTVETRLAKLSAASFDECVDLLGKPGSTLHGWFRLLTVQTDGVVPTRPPEDLRKTLLKVGDMMTDLGRVVFAALSAGVDSVLLSKASVDCRGHLVHEDEHEENASLVGSWLALKEAAIFIGAFLKAAPVCDCSEIQAGALDLLTHPEWHALLFSLLNLVLSSRHPGVVGCLTETIRVLAGRLRKSNWEAAVVGDALAALTDLVTGKPNPRLPLPPALRKSLSLCQAAVPLLVVEIPPYPSTCALMESLLALTVNVPTSEPSPAEDDARVHVLNLLRALCRSRGLTDATAAYLDRCLSLAVCHLKHPSWPCRNSANLLFEAVINRLSPHIHFTNSEVWAEDHKLSTIAQHREKAFDSYSSRHVEEIVVASPTILQWLAETFDTDDFGPLLTALELLSRLSWVAARQLSIGDAVYRHLGSTCKHVRIFASRVVANMVMAAWRDDKVFTWVSDLEHSMAQPIDDNMREGLLLTTLELASRVNTPDLVGVEECVKTVIENSRNDPLRLVALLVAEALELDVVKDVDAFTFEPTRVVAVRVLTRKLVRTQDHPGISQLLSQIDADDEQLLSAVRLVDDTSSIHHLQDFRWRGRTPRLLEAWLQLAIRSGGDPTIDCNWRSLIEAHQHHPTIPFLGLQLVLRNPDADVDDLIVKFGRQDAPPAVKQKLLAALTTTTSDLSLLVYLWVVSTLSVSMFSLENAGRNGVNSTSISATPIVLHPDSTSQSGDPSGVNASLHSDPGSP